MADRASTTAEAGGDRDLLVVTGKGGVGKSTVTAAIALAAAAAGRRVLVAELGGRADVPRVLGRIGARPDHISIDARRALDAYLAQQLPGVLAGVLARSRVFLPLTAAAPGLAELLSIGQVCDLTWSRDREAPPAYDLVVLDAPSTGHALTVLGAPASYARLAHGGPVRRQAAAIEQRLRDPSTTAVIVVATAEEMAVNETVALLDALRTDVGMHVQRVVVNRLLPAPLGAADAKALRAAPPDPAISSALWLDRAARAQRRQLARLRAAVSTTPLSTVAFSFDGPPGAAELQAVGEDL